MKIFLLIIICILYFSVFSQPPKWIDSKWRNIEYPDVNYLLGFASENNNKNQDENDLLKKLENFAKSQLSESVVTSISSLSELSMSENNGKLQEYFKKNCTSSTRIEIAGLKTENYYDQKEKIAYAIAFVKKEEVYNLYKNNIEEKIKNIIQKISSAEKYISSKDNQNALKNYFECYPYFRSVEEAQGVYLALKNKLSDDTDLKIKEITDYKIKVENGIKELQKNNNNSLDDICYFLAYGFNLQTGKINEPIRLTNFSYKDTKMSSEFSRKLSSILEQKLVSTTAYNITTEAILPNSSGAINNYLLTGSYWDEGENMKIISILRNAEGKAIASTEAFVSLAWFKSNNISFLPENFKEAYSNMKVFSKNEIKGGDLIVEVWTNKGNENLIYTKGDRMKLFVRVNKECYLRFIYYLADGSKVLLLDNYYIGSDKVNFVYELPVEFECTEPFGIETLQLNAQTEKFQSLIIKTQDGYDIIQEKLKDVLVKTRGMKRIDNKINIQVEKRVIITTMAK